MTQTRRDMIRGAVLAGAAAGWPRAAASQVDAPDEVVELWPAGLPAPPATALIPRTERSGDRARPNRVLTGIAKPRLIVRRAVRPNGAAMLLIPGGGYRYLSYDNEGTEQAAWLNALGVTCFILLHRLPGEGWRGRADVPLADAQRALRVIRARARAFNVDPARVGVLGFSAGGHLAGSLATRHGEQVYRPVDAADDASAAPALAALIYPVVTLEQSFVHAGSRDTLLGAGAPVAETQRRSVERAVGVATPPIFLAHAADDAVVPPMNSISLFTAMQAARRPVELHIFEEGGHGFGVRLPADRPASKWPNLLTAFAVRHGLWRSGTG